MEMRQIAIPGVSLLLEDQQKMIQLQFRYYTVVLVNGDHRIVLLTSEFFLFPGLLLRDAGSDVFGHRTLVLSEMDVPDGAELLLDYGSKYWGDKTKGD